VAEEIWSKVGLGSVFGKQLVRGMERCRVLGESDPKLTGTPGGPVGVAGSAERNRRHHDIHNIIPYDIARIKESE